MSLISTLPGATEFKSDHYSGYLRVSDTKRIFFYFVESENHPLQDSTIFLINGGPGINIYSNFIAYFIVNDFIILLICKGCSGLLAAFIQNGPWKIMSDGSLLNNEYSWSTRSNVVYLDLPVNTGFSFSTSSDADRVYNDDVSSDESLASITAFFKIFPDLTNNPFFVASEGYGGHFAPQVALKILEQEDTVITTHFAGIIVGNPLVNFKANLIAQAETRWGFQLISKRVW